MLLSIACGRRTPETESALPPSDPQPKVTSPKSGKNKIDRAIKKTVTIASIGTLESGFQGAQAAVSICNLVHLGNRVFVAPEHCVKGYDSVSAYWDDQKQPSKMRVIARIQPRSTEVDALVLMRPELENSEPPRDKIDLEGAFIGDNLSYSEEFIMLSRQADGKVAERPCPPHRYNSDGLVAYGCDTSGGMSGALLVLKSSRAPIGIHLGRKSGVGYGVAFNAISRIAREFVESKTQVRSSNR